MPNIGSTLSLTCVYEERTRIQTETPNRYGLVSMVAIHAYYGEDADDVAIGLIHMDARTTADPLRVGEGALELPQYREGNQGGPDEGPVSNRWVALADPMPWDVPRQAIRAYSPLRYGTSDFTSRLLEFLHRQLHNVEDDALPAHWQDVCQEAHTHDFREPPSRRGNHLLPRSPR